MVMVVEVWVLISEKTSYDFRHSVERLFTKYHNSVAGIERTLSEEKGVCSDVLFLP